MRCDVSGSKNGILTKEEPLLREMSDTASSSSIDGLWESNA